MLLSCHSTAISFSMSVDPNVKNYILDVGMAQLFDEMAAAILRDRPRDLKGYLLEWLKKVLEHGYPGIWCCVSGSTGLQRSHIVWGHMCSYELDAWTPSPPPPPTHR